MRGLAHLVALTAVAGIAGFARVIHEREILFTLFLNLCALVWMISGRPPWIWLAIGLLHFEVFRQQAIASLRVAVVDFRESYPYRHQRLRSDVLDLRGIRE